MGSTREAGSHEERQDNNFDFLRLVAASFVVFYHCFPLTGTQQFSIFGLLGVSIFFIISGYFITRSWQMHPSPVRFVWNRFLRVMPALFVVLLMTVLIIGPLVTELPLWAYFTDYRTWLYMLNVPLLGPYYLLPGVFVHNIYPYEVNTPIWTLQVEARMYLVILLLGAAGVLAKKRWVAAGTALLAAFFVAVYDLGIGSQGLAFLARLPFLNMPMHDFRFPLFYCALFMIGSLFYLYRDSIPLRPDVALGLTVLWFVSGFTPYFYTLSLLCMPYVVLCAGFMKLPLVNQLSRHGDYSYGLYILAFPIQQTIVHFYPGIGPWGLLTTALPIALIFAMLSWDLVESRALELKRKDPLLLWKNAARTAPLILRPGSKKN